MLGLEVKSHWLLSNCKTHSNSKAFLSLLSSPTPPSLLPSLPASVLFMLSGLLVSGTKSVVQGSYSVSSSAFRHLALALSLDNKCF